MSLVGKAALVTAQRALARSGGKVTGPVALGQTALPSRQRGSLPPLVGGAKVNLTAFDRHYSLPGLTLTRDGVLVAAWRNSNHHNVVTGENRGIIEVARSHDLGLTWDDPITAVDLGSDDARDCGLACLSDGTLLLTGFRADAGDSSAGPVQGAYVSRSSDGGLTWSAPVVMTGPFTQRNITTGWIVELPNGTLAAPLYGRNTGDETTRRSVAVTFSTDRGATWGDAVVAADGPTDSKDYVEPVLVLLDDGTLMCMIREDADDKIVACTSNDSGKTWGGATVLFSGSGRPATILTETGKLLCFYRAGSTTAMRSSSDLGENWSELRVVEGIAGESSMYAQPVEVAPGCVAVCYAQEIVADQETAQVRLRYVTEGAIPSPLGDIVTPRKIFDHTLVNASASIEVDGISDVDGSDLEITISGRAGGVAVNLYLNDDETDTNYWSTRVRAVNTTVEADNSNTPRVGFFGDADVEQNIIVRIPNFSTTRNKSGLAHYVQVNGFNATAIVTGQITYAWSSTAAITKLKIATASGTFNVGTRVVVRVL